MVNAAPPKDTSNHKNKRNVGWPELQMPRDALLLSPMSQALLRAARMGQVNKPPPPPLEDDKDPGDEDDGDGDVDAAFVARRWAVVPRHLEGPEPEYLAKRRKGLPYVYGGSTGPQGNSVQMRKTKIRMMDTEGNSSVWDVLVPQGQTVEGEIIEEETAQTHAPAPGTVVAGVAVVNAEGVVITGDQGVPTPLKKRPPPPKRKAKGPGRGRRKKVGFVSISSGATMAQRANMGLTGPVVRNGVEKQIPTGDQGVAHVNIEIRDDLVLQEGEEGSEDDDEGEEGEDNDREEGELSPSPGSISKSPARPPIPKVSEPEIIPDVPELTLTEPEIPIDRDPSSSPDLPLAAGQGFQPPVIQINPVQEAVIVPAPELRQIPVTEKISVEEPPPPQQSSANAELPPGHDLLNGLMEPKVPEKVPEQVPEDVPEDVPEHVPEHVPENVPDKAAANPDDVLHYPDGEQDLLGSLEMSLGRRGDGS